MVNIPTGIYEHYKGKRYEVLGVARHSETQEMLVVYKMLYQSDYPEGTLWVRPLLMFTEHVSVNGIRVPRFRHLNQS